MQTPCYSVSYDKKCCSLINVVSRNKELPGDLDNEIQHDMRNTITSDFNTRLPHDMRSGTNAVFRSASDDVYSEILEWVQNKDANDHFYDELVCEDLSSSLKEIKSCGTLKNLMKFEKCGNR